ncbi:TIGR03564 family F420-dependent LLM class oxidoreductase [Thermopolyspora sp. NPDC052614]|uniref:TIGR03564 family F420-dependent LLM class oxidoreductase n=1 Tax=Thermopolyspora sp. NPDC052614 TaxID=3155682 RepID=UPI003420E23F
MSLNTMGPVADVAAEAALAVSYGLDSVWAGQQPGGLDALSVLAAAGDGPREVGTAVAQTYPVHPVARATAALTVQELVGGRLTLGLGPSHAWIVTGQLGIPYTAPARHTREYLEVLRPLLRGEHVKYSGEFFTVDAQLAVNVPAPPVLISAMGPRMLQIAHDLADGTIATWVRPATVADWLVPRLADGARVVVGAMVAVTNDPDAVREAVATNLSIVNDMPAYRAILDRGGLSGPADAIIVGSESEVLAELRRFRDAGTTDLLVAPFCPPEERGRVLEVAAQARS